MKKFEATFHKTVWFNCGMRECKVTKIIEAKTLNSAKNKALKMEQCGPSKTWYLLKNVIELG